MLSITAEYNTFFQKDITKIIYPTSDFGYFGHAWPLPSKKIMPICKNFYVYLHAKNQLQIKIKTNYLTSF